MNYQDTFSILTVGWDHSTIKSLYDRIAEKSEYHFSHIVHPKYTPQDWPSQPPHHSIYFFRDSFRQHIPNPDYQFLASLEQEGVPTIHNMIMGDRIVSKIEYDDALGYATFLAQRLFDLFNRVKPSVIIGAFDGIHAGIAYAVAKRMNIPWFALNFSVIPAGLTCFCEQMSPAVRVPLSSRSSVELQTLAEATLQQFEENIIQAPAYIAPLPLTLASKITKIPKKLMPLYRTIRKARHYEYLKFTEPKTGYSVLAVLSNYFLQARARKALSRIKTLKEPPATPFVFFGLHMQPESSIDVWAPFYSNQIWVVELLSRSIPPTHKLLVKIHKSDISNYSRNQLNKMKSLPGVELVEPSVDTKKIIQNADLIIAIQGTIGIEGALLGKPVITLGDSPNVIFPSVSRIGEITDLPALIRKKLTEVSPSRKEIVNAYASFLAPFSSASTNDWTIPITDEQIVDYVNLFNSLKQYMLEKKHALTLHDTSVTEKL